MSDAPLGSEHKWATQTILGYDAWTSGLTLAPGGLGTMIALMISGRLVSRIDQRLILLLIPFMRRVRSGRGARGPRGAEGSESGARDPGLPAPAD